MVKGVDVIVGCFFYFFFGFIGWGRRVVVRRD